MNIAVITGASSGLGKEFALTLDRGLMCVDEFWLIARRRDRLEELASRLDHAARILPLDLTLDEDRRSFDELLHRERPVIRMLINCSGYGIMGLFSRLPLKEQSGMIELNCLALTELTYSCLPFMKKKSRIIQLASSAAFLPQPDFAVYAASKSYVLSFSRALREELRERQIYVTAVCPGPVRTEFFDLAERRGTTLAIKKYTMVEADRVVRDALRASARRRELSVCSLPIRAFRFLAAAVPHSVLLRIMRHLKTGTL